MRRSARLSAKPANDAQIGPRAKKKRSDGRTTNIATIDNGTMLETFKFLNYCQLAKNSLVSKRYRDLIRGHRHKLALLYVGSLILKNKPPRPSLVRIFNKKLSAEDYKEWVIRNGYSSQIPIEGVGVQKVEGVQKQSAQYYRRVYLLWAKAFYNDPNSRQSSESSFVLYAEARLKHKHWPLFQHFVRLLTDPFIYIRQMELIPQNDFLNLLAGAIAADRCHVQCESLKFHHDGNFPKLVEWAKNHMHCNEFQIVDRNLNYDEELLDLLVNGSHCTSAINTYSYDISNVIFGYLQKFMELKSSDECQLVESLQGRFAGPKVMETLKRDYAGCIVNEGRHEEGNITERVIEIVNSEVGKKFQITEEIIDTGDGDENTCEVSIKICNG